MIERTRYLTYPQVAELLQVSERTIQNLVRDQKIPHVKIGRATRFHPVDIEKWMLAIRRGVIRDN